MGWRYLKCRVGNNIKRVTSREKETDRIVRTEKYREGGKKTGWRYIRVRDSWVGKIKRTDNWDGEIQGEIVGTEKYREEE